MSMRDVFDRLSGARAREEREMEAEMSFHIEEETARNVRMGMTPEAARLEAVRNFGGQDRYSEEARDQRPTRWVEDAWQDVRYSLRMLARAPMFTMIAVFSLALGLGANTAVFSVVRGVLLRPLPYNESDRITRVYVTPTEDPSVKRSLSSADLFAFKQRSRVFEEVGGWSRQQGGVALSGLGDAIQLPASLATSGAFRVLGVQPLLGRYMNADDDKPDATSVALLSYELWQQRFGGDRSIIGRSVIIEGTPNNVIGVMPRGFRFPGSPDDQVWLSLQLSEPRGRAPFWLSVVGRRKPGVTDAAVNTELAQMETWVKDTYKNSPKQWNYSTVALKDALVADARATLLLLFGAVALVLSIAAANLANLLLARATTRSSEMALRSSLGAGRARLVRQMLTESLVISGLGTIFGLALAYWGVRIAVATRLGNLARIEEVKVDGMVLGFTLAVAILVGILTGLVPAFRLSRNDLASSIRHGGRAVAGSMRGGVRNGLVVVEFAFALIVLVIAGLLLNSLVRLNHVNTGIGAEQMLAVRISAPEATYASGEPRLAFFERVALRFTRLPGVKSVALSMALPPSRLVMSNPFTPEGKTFATNESAPVAEELSISPSYFETLGIPIHAGRAFTDADRDSATVVGIVNETLAERYLGGRDAAIGKWIQTGDPNPESPHVFIVGVVADVKYSGLDTPPTPTIYVPYRQNAWWGTMYVAMRTQGGSASLLPLARAALKEIDPNVPIMDSFTLDDLQGDAIATPRLRALLLGAFALLALLLATGGIYGVMSYAVTQRRQEMGVRIALGAQPRDIIRDVLAQGARLTIAGIVVGLAGAYVVARMASTLLFDVGALDGATYIAVVAILAVVGMTACAIPALRAARTDPALAFRGD